MIRVFRTIRENRLAGSKWPDHFPYAAGELFLVTVGILIALQVNNCNEERIERQQIKEYGVALINALERDTAMVRSIAKQVRNTLNDSADMLRRSVEIATQS